MIVTTGTGADTVSTRQIVVQGHIQLDGTLLVEEKVSLPPGPVYVTVQPAAPRPPHRRTLDVLQEIWAEREALGVKGRSAEEIEAEINAMRDEDEQRMREIEGIARQPASRKE
jgi:hypothetical protein